MVENWLLEILKFKFIGIHFICFTSFRRTITRTIKDLLEETLLFCYLLRIIFRILKLELLYAQFFALLHNQMRYYG